jgi:Integrase zinc binding domain
MADFPLELKHIAGRRNRADPLSRRPDYDDGSHDNEGLTALPEAMFGRIIEATALDQMVEDEQMDQSTLLKDWEMTHNLQQDTKGLWHKGFVLVVPPEDRLRRALVELNHDSTTAAHPGIDKTHQAPLKQYWWPGC